ncbi:hypothetical protein [Lacihabitans soyangensis]|uniref:hypothetical protein n=1 Tax=Lacihabitans soyangensis TaxID=869394 RepID=UPI0020CCFA73|nr:hypothetical protein [Lacihabitans soyangensis]
MNKIFKVFKETAVPATWQADAVYFIQAAGATYMEIYTTSAAGVPKRLINEADITSMISAGLAAANELTIVADIAARNALAPTRAMNVFVRNATADTTVASGGAYYLYDLANTAWIKTSEAESLDVVLTWNALQGKPTSTAAQIDAAVGNSHSHANKTQLDKISETDGNLYYNGSLPKTAWASTNW